MADDGHSARPTTPKKKKTFVRRRVALQNGESISEARYSLSSSFLVLCERIIDEGVSVICLSLSSWKHTSQLAWKLEQKVIVELGRDNSECLWLHTRARLLPQPLLPLKCWQSFKMWLLLLDRPISLLWKLWLNILLLALPPVNPYHGLAALELLLNWFLPCLCGRDLSLRAGSNLPPALCFLFWNQVSSSTLIMLHQKFTTSGSLTIFLQAIAKMLSKLLLEISVPSSDLILPRANLLTWPTNLVLLMFAYLFGWLWLCKNAKFQRSPNKPQVF